MAQFTLSWNNTSVLASANVINLRALYRYKTVGGSFISTGFTPTNDMAKSVVTADTPELDENKVVETKVQSICTDNGPTDNDNGLQEAIEFACIVPTLTKTDTTGTIEVDTTGLDITKIRFTLRKAIDNTIVGTATTVNASISAPTSISKTGLIQTTNYYWQVELYATVNNIEIKSEVCSPYPFTTNSTIICDPLTDFIITSIEIV